MAGPAPFFLKKSEKERLFFGDNPEKRILGWYGQINIRVIIDHFGRAWFAQKDLVELFERSQSTFSKLRTGHPESFVEWEAWCSIRTGGARQIHFSLLGLDMLDRFSSAPALPDFKLWAARLLQYEAGLYSKRQLLMQSSLREEPSDDLPPLHRQLQSLSNRVSQSRDRLNELRRQKLFLEQFILEESAFLKMHEDFEEDAYTFVDLAPFERTLFQLTDQVRWWNHLGAPHTIAVLLFALNQEFDEKGWLREEEGLWVFTDRGSREFFLLERPLLGPIGPIVPTARVRERYGFVHARTAFKF
jgi:hypothetical protein